MKHYAMTTLGENVGELKFFSSETAPENLIWGEVANYGCYRVDVHLMEMSALPTEEQIDEDGDSDIFDILWDGEDYEGIKCLGKWLTDLSVVEV